MVNIGLSANFKHQVFQWDGASGMLGQTDLKICKMREVVIQTEEPVSTRESTERMVRVLDSNYTRAEPEQVVANVTQLNAEERNKILGLLKDFENFFDVNLGDWDAEPVDLELNPDDEPFNCKYHPVPRINKETFGKSQNVQ